MKNIKRVFLIILDSFGVGELPDAAKFGDTGSHTLKACFDSTNLNVPNMKKLGLFNINGVGCGEKAKSPLGAFAKLKEASQGKDTTVGHWEISGVISEKPLPVYPNGFPAELIREFEEKTGRKVICNIACSGTKALSDFGQEHIETGGLIVYTSADSVWQIAAHEDVVPTEKLYEYCQIARDMLVGEHAVGRVIARPFVGKFPNFTRTSNRHDFSLIPPAKTVLNYIKDAGLETIGVGKISDIFAGQGISESQRTLNNSHGMKITIEHIKEDWNGLCFVNLVDFDMQYGHRNDVDGYTKALNLFDEELGQLLPLLNDDDVLMLSADHGCDPSTPSTDHSREYIPLLVYGNSIKAGVNLGIRETFADIGATVADLLDVKADIAGKSFAKEIII